METAKKKSTRGMNYTIAFSKEDGERIKIAAEVRGESVSKFVRTVVKEKLKSLGYQTEDE